MQRDHYATPSAYEKTLKTYIYYITFQPIVNRAETITTIRLNYSNRQYIRISSPCNTIFLIKLCKIARQKKHEHIRIRSFNHLLSIKPTKTERLFWVFDFTICYLLVAFATKCRRMQ